MQAVSEENFDKELESAIPVLVKFGAEWCGPCKQIAPVLEELSSEYADRIKFLSVDIDEAPAIAPRFGIRGVPTILIFRDGQVINTLVGNQAKGRLQLAIDTVLA